MDIAVRRKLRAGLRYSHIINGDEGDILRYKARNKAALNDPNIAQADFFSNKAGGIEVIEGDSTIGDIDDIIHHIETWWVESPVPRALLGYGRDLNRDVLREQKAQYDEGLPAVQSWVADQIVKPILETQWLLAGILPETISYTIGWETKRLSTPDDILKIGQAAQVLRGLGIPDESIAVVMATFLPGVSPDMIQLAAVGNTADAARLAQIQNKLGV